MPLSSQLSCLGPRPKDDHDENFATQAKAAVDLVIGGVASGLATAGTAFARGVASGYGVVDKDSRESRNCMATS